MEYVNALIAAAKFWLDANIDHVNLYLMIAVIVVDLPLLYILLANYFKFKGDESL